VTESAGSWSGTGTGPGPTVVQHGVSFDVEDWHQLQEIRISGRLTDVHASVEGCIERILALCDEAGIKATFFVLGLLARSRPEIVRSIAARGHEIASHSSRHQLVDRMTPEAFVADLLDSKALLEDLSGAPVVGYRAPEFSMKRLDQPAFTALRRAGFLYDSSVFPVPVLRYGIPEAPTGRFTVPTEAGDLVELPLATTTIGTWRLPIAGGSHWRVLPTSFVTWAARRAEQTMVFYFHPYEFSTSLLYLEGAGLRNRHIWKHLILHNLRTSRVEKTLRALLGQFKFAPLRELAVA
jgi:polysaccharide deacetylase family protein (PEP-CTERM system associated)